MTLQPFPLSDQYGYPSHGWNVPDGGTTAVPVSGVYAHRYNVFYEGQEVKLNSFAYPGGPFTWRAVQMIPSFNSSKDLGDVVASGNFDAGTASIGFYTTFTLGTFPAGSYCVLFDDLSDTDANYGTSTGRAFFSVLRRRMGFPQVDVDLASTTWSSSRGQYKTPNGFGMSDAQVDAGGVAQSQCDMVLRSVCSMGVGRVNIVGTNNGKFQPNTGSQTLNGAADFFTNVGGPYYLNPRPAWTDTVRTRQAWVAIPNASNTYDILVISGSSGSFAFVYPKTPSVDGSKVFVKATAGTSSGVKVQVYYPDASTLVETFDNQTTGGVTAGTASSDYIKAFGAGGTGLTAISTPTAIGNENRNAIINIVQTLGPLGCTRFEGPFNEPTPSAQIAHQFWLFADAVNSAGITGAKAIGPTPVAISGGSLTAIEVYLDALAATGLTANDFCFAFHDYNSMENSDVNELRYQIEALLIQVYARFPAIELWQTEANYAVPDQTPVFTPAYAKRGVTHQLLWEQYGLPRERNPHWYDGRLGNFFSKPWFVADGTYSLHPVAVLYSVLGQETFRKAFHHRIDFGSVPANAVFSGSVYGTPILGGVAVMWCHSNMPGSTVTLKVLTGSPLTLTTVDAAGVTGTVSPDGSGLITVTVPEYPMYVRLPAGVTVRVHHVRDWAPPMLPSVSRGRTTTVLGGSTKTELTDDQFKQVDGNTATGLAVSSASLPDTAEITFTTNLTPVTHVIAFSGPAIDAQPGLLTYTVQTYNGTTWTTQAIKLPDGTYGTTLTKTVPASFLHGDGRSSQGTTRDQYARLEWIDDIEFQTPVATFKGFRLNATALTYGGAVDTAADALMSGYGRSSGSDPKLHLQEIMVLSAASPTASGLSAPVVQSAATVQGG